MFSKLEHWFIYRGVLLQPYVGHEADVYPPETTSWVVIVVVIVSVLTLALSKRAGSYVRHWWGVFCVFRCVVDVGPEDGIQNADRFLGAASNIVHNLNARPAVYAGSE